jgi:hypothetical protein
MMMMIQVATVGSWVGSGGPVRSTQNGSPRAFKFRTEIGSVCTGTPVAALPRPAGAVSWFSSLNLDTVQRQECELELMINTRSYYLAETEDGVPIDQLTNPWKRM